MSSGYFYSSTVNISARCTDMSLTSLSLRICIETLPPGYPSPRGTLPKLRVRSRVLPFSKQCPIGKRCTFVYHTRQ